MTNMKRNTTDITTTFMNLTTTMYDSYESIMKVMKPMDLTLTVLDLTTTDEVCTKSYQNMVKSVHELDDDAMTPTCFNSDFLQQLLFNPSMDAIWLGEILSPFHYSHHSLIIQQLYQWQDENRLSIVPFSFYNSKKLRRKVVPVANSSKKRGTQWHAQLHLYNQLKDATQQLLGYLAQIHQTTVRALHERYDLTTED